MTTPACQSPLAWETLLAYWLGELDADGEARVEEHYLGCGPCSRRLEQLEALAHGVGAVARNSGVPMVVDDRFIGRLREAGRRVREYRLPLNGSVNCTIAPEDEFLVGRMEAPLGGVRRLDMVSLVSGIGLELRQEDVPFVADSGAVVFCPGIEMMRSLPAVTWRVRLLAVDDAGERTIGEYTFNHSPPEPLV